MTNRQDIERMKAVAEAATPGEWTVTKDDCASCGGEWDIYEIPGGAHAKFERKEDATFIATFDPPAVLALIADNEALEGKLRYLDERGEFFAKVLKLPDGGRYRHDWIVRLQKLLDAEARATALEGALQRIADATPGNSNTASLAEFRSHVSAIALTALDARQALVSHQGTQK